MSNVRTVVRRDAAGVAGLPDTVHLETMSPWQILLVRTARVFLQSFSSAFGFTALGGLEATTGVNIEGLAVKLKAALIFAAVSALGTFVWNATELLARIDIEHPKFRA